MYIIISQRKHLWNYHSARNYQYQKSPNSVTPDQYTLTPTTKVTNIQTYMVITFFFSFKLLTLKHALIQTLIQSCLGFKISFCFM